MNGKQIHKKRKLSQKKLLKEKRQREREKPKWKKTAVLMSVISIGIGWLVYANIANAMNKGGAHISVDMLGVVVISLLMTAYAFYEWLH